MRSHRHETAVVVVASLGTALLLQEWLRIGIVAVARRTPRLCFVWGARGHVELYGVFQLRSKSIFSTRGTFKGE